MSEVVRTTVNGLHVTSDDGQNVRVGEMRECPWCGRAEGLEPYVQTWDLGADYAEARVVCASCHASTTRLWQNRTELVGTGEDVTRDLAIEKAVAAWNRRAERTCIDDGVGVFRCSACGAFAHRGAVTDLCGSIPIRYCPNCGAKLV